MGQVMRVKEISVRLEMSDDAGHLAVPPSRSGTPGTGQAERAGRERGTEQPAIA